MKTLELTDFEFNALQQIIDAALRQAGSQVLMPCALITQKMAQVDQATDIPIQQASDDGKAAAEPAAKGR